MAKLTLRKNERREVNEETKDNNFIFGLMKYAQKNGFIYKNGNWFGFIYFMVNDYSIKEFVKISSLSEIDANQVESNEMFLSILNTEIQKISIEKRKERFLNKLNEYTIPEDVRDKIIQAISEKTNKLIDMDFNENTLFTVLGKNVDLYLKLKAKEKIIEELNIGNYEFGFPVARSLNREIKIIVGPTNSGKTYDALQDLMQAQSGVYLAPLRLLAMEIYDKLNANGVPCNLITGEEKIILPNARHTASTVEILNTENVVDVAIIDEFQMLSDPQRGWAWTAAMVGVPAKKVYVIGNSQKLESAKSLYEKLKENVNIVEKQRFSELMPLKTLVNIKNLKAGDALIAFSRQDVLGYATKLRDSGFTVSVIYGALSPEVRRKQAELFNTGQTDILVSTDAIGMGLNLPIKRVIFATIKKYDGISVRELTLAEFLQIAGRAGRYKVSGVKKLHDKDTNIIEDEDIENGYVGALDNDVNDSSVNAFIHKNVVKSTSRSSLKMNVAPSEWHIEVISETLKTKNLKDILTYFSSLIHDSIFKCADLSHMCELFVKIKPYLNGLDLLEQYKLIKAPIETFNHELVNDYCRLINEIRKGNPVKLKVDKYYNLETAEIENKKLTIYAWLSFYYNQLDTSEISEERELLSDFIQDALKRERKHSFSQMIEPKVYNNYYSRSEYLELDDDDEEDYS